MGQTEMSLAETVTGQTEVQQRALLIRACVTVLKHAFATGHLHW